MIYTLLIFTYRICVIIVFSCLTLFKRALAYSEYVIYGLRCNLLCLARATRTWMSYRERVFYICLFTSVYLINCKKKRKPTVIDQFYWIMFKIYANRTPVIICEITAKILRFIYVMLCNVYRVFRSESNKLCQRTRKHAGKVSQFHSGTLIPVYTL